MGINLSNGKITRPRIALQKSVMTDPTADQGPPYVTQDTGFQLLWSFDCITLLFIF
jgi:hypothetical protein